MHADMIEHFVYENPQMHMKSSCRNVSAGDCRCKGVEDVVLVVGSTQKTTNGRERENLGKVGGIVVDAYSQKQLALVQIKCAIGGCNSSCFTFFHEFFCQENLIFKRPHILMTGDTCPIFLRPTKV